MDCNASSLFFARLCLLLIGEIEKPSEVARLIDEAAVGATTLL